MEESELRLTSRRLPIILIGGAAIIAIAVVVMIVLIVSNKPIDRPPTDADRTALAAEVCPRVLVTHLYRVEKDGKTSHLFGTRHAGVSLARFPPKVAETFATAKTLVIESPAEDDDDSRPRRDARSVEEQLGPRSWAHYRNLVGPELADKVNHTSIWEATTTLAVLYEDMSQLLDVELERLAKQSNKPILGLDEQLDDLSEHYVGIEVLHKTLVSLGRRTTLKAFVRQNLRAYCTGKNEVPPFDEITYLRTRKWVRKLQPILAEGGAFIAVGNAHVEAGENGLVEMLRADGFSVEPVM